VWHKVTRADSNTRTASREQAGENRETAHASPELPVNDPLRELSPTAARLLEAAKTILARDGFAHLTFGEIAAESGETGSLIRYHFGSKIGRAHV
jgi:AcrR family transcriptional regulator